MRAVALVVAAGTAMLAWAEQPTAAPAAASASASVAAVPAMHREQVERIAKKVLFGQVELETTVFRPPGDGPFPLVVLNHGKSAGDTRFQPRWRPLRAVGFFVQRGFAVLVPMRQGFAASGGAYIGAGCNVESNGEQQAEDVKTVLDWAAAQPWADSTAILVVGQSHGGWTTLALGALGHPGVKGLVNFAGGLRQESCAGWQANLGRAAGAYGARTKVPSIWFYGDNDSYFAPATYRGMAERYAEAGGRVELVEFGPFGSDAHAMFGSAAGDPIWQPRVQAFMTRIGLPWRAAPGTAAADAPPPPTPAN